MLNKCTPSAAAVANTSVPAGTPAARETIEKLISIERQAHRVLVEASSAGPRVAGWHKGLKAAQRDHKKAREQLERAQREAIKAFAVSRGWKYEGGFSASELHTYELHLTWCETCGNLCQFSYAPRCFQQGHTSGRHDAFCYPHRDDPWRTEAVVHHTKHPFERCEGFAALFGFKVTRLTWSWYGPELTAVLFERASK